MSAVEPAVRPQGHGDISVALDERTLEILARRRAASRPIRRGWLVRRALVVADLVGLFDRVPDRDPDLRRPGAGRTPIATRIGDPGLPPDLAAVGRRREALRALRPRRGAHRPLDRPTTSSPVLHLVTVGSWLFFGVHDGHADARTPGWRASSASGSSRSSFITAAPRRRSRLSRARAPRLRPEHDHRRRGRRRPARGEASCGSIPSTASTSSASSTTGRRSGRASLERPRAPGRARAAPGARAGRSTSSA